MLKQTIFFCVTAASLASAAAFGCSSSSSTTTTNPDGGGTVTPGTDSGGTVTPGTDSSTGNPDAGTTPPKSDAGADAAPTCPAAVNPGTDIPPYAATTATTGLCTTQQVNDFITACYSQTATGKTCNAWFNVAANATCGNCVSPADSSGKPISGGPQVVNPTTGSVIPNTPGCVALVDKTNGATCAPKLSDYSQCEDVACGGCSSQSTFSGCEQSTSTGSGACASYYTAFTGACASDVLDSGIASQSGECQDPVFIFNLYCGGADGGAPVADAGDGG